MVRAGGDGPWQGLSCWHGSRSCLAARRRRRPQASDRRPGARGGPRQHPDREAARRARPDEAGRGSAPRPREARPAPRATRTGHREALEVDEAERLAGARSSPRRGRPLGSSPPGGTCRRTCRARAWSTPVPALPGLRRELAPDRQDVTESLDYVPGRFKVVRHVREAFACRACEQVVQAPPPHNAVPRGRGRSPGSWPTSRWRSSTTIFRCIAGRDLRARRRRSGDLDALGLARRDCGHAAAADRASAPGGDRRLGRSCTATTRRSRCWRPARARRAPGGCGPTCGMSVPWRRPSAGGRCSSPRPTVEASSARSRTWRPSPDVLVADGYPGFNGLYEGRASGRRAA